MAGYISNTDEQNPWLILAAIGLALIAAPILFPINLGLYVSKNI